MSKKRWFQYEEIEGSIESSEIIIIVMESLIGTRYIESKNFKNNLLIGRTFFDDRTKKHSPVNDSLIIKLGHVCTDVLSGQSNYDPTTASFNLEKLFHQHFSIRTDFLRFSDDDGDSLRSAKASSWKDLLINLFMQIKGVDIVSKNDISLSMDGIVENSFLKIKKMSLSTPFESVLKKIEKEIGYPDSLEENSTVKALFSEKESGNFTFDGVFKEYRIEFEERFPIFCPIFSKYEVSDFITKVMECFNNKSLIWNTKQNIASGVFASILRTAYFFDKFEGKSGSQMFIMLENNLACLANDLPIPIQMFLSLSRTATFTELSELSNKAFYRKGIGEHERSAIAFAVLAIYFTDLFLIISRYPQKYADMIRYKTNADVCQNLSKFSRHVIFQNIPVVMDTPKRRIDICLSCNEANAHKAAALFINEFERALSGFEDIFAHLDLQLYYVRASVNPFGQDNVTNHNFEAYTPTLMPLLSGGHLYSTNLVFIRELVQNAIDSISVRKLMQGTDFDTGINITLSADTASGQIHSLTANDNGMGMGRIEIERYLTSIGRSYYTARDFKKLKLSYRPISSFGIGFLSCFLVCQIIDIKTHSVTDDGSYLLSIPNIEGCFFIEETDQDLPYGTSIRMVMNETSIVSIYELLEYAWVHFLDISYNLDFSWEGDAMVIMKLEDENKNHPRIANIDLAQYARQETQEPPCPFSFVDDGVLLPTERASIFQHRWWNQYIRNQYGGIGLIKYRSLINSFSIPAHVARRVGEKFFLFLSFQKNGDVSFLPFDTVEDTFTYDYGIFITDLPLAGLKIRSKEKGLKPYSGKLRILNAGILVDDASLESLFGENMRIYVSDQEAAYNDVIINFPPDWIELNVAREKIVRISPTVVGREKLLTGIASSTVEALNYFLNVKRDIPMINIQEIASFITVVCNELNNDETGTGRKLLTELKKKKFLLIFSADSDGIHYKMIEDNGEDMDMKIWFDKNLPLIRKYGSIEDNVLTEDFYRNFEIQMGKKRVAEIGEINNGLAEQYHVPQSYIDSLDHDLALVVFAAYLCYFPDSRIAKYSVKAAHSRLALERQLMKKYSVADFSKGGMQWVVTYREAANFACAIWKNSIDATISNDRKM